MNVEAMVERVWPGREARVEVLGGGITNHNFKISLDDGAYVLRIGGKDTALLGIDRRAEHAASLAAHEAGVAPEVVAFVEPEGYLVTRFLEARIPPPEELRAPEQLARVAAALRAFHSGRPLPSRFDSFRVVEAYHATAAAHGVAPPRGFDRAREVAGRIEAVRGAPPPRPCHNDLLNANFLDDGERLWIVDWEYAGMGDPCFDLANFSINHELDDEANRGLLAAYFGGLRTEDERALRLMRFMSDFREAMWGVVQQGISELDFDFVAYADEHFERLERTAAEPSFRAALDG